ncbi:hypothetical protein DFH09DRAFT_1095391 [Mycena vulgaris]|nr:hypothetical protein DFH09DRAFT_1095391 [Mycena vulgaris]
MSDSSSGISPENSCQVPQRSIRSLNARQEIGVPDVTAWLEDGVSEGMFDLAFPALTSMWNTTDFRNASPSDHLPYNPFFLNTIAQGETSRPLFPRSTYIRSEGQRPIRSKPGISRLRRHCLFWISRSRCRFWGISGTSDNILVPSSSPDAQFIFYVVTVDAYTFSGSDAVFTQNNKTGLDSGTTLTFVPSPMAVAYNAQFSPPARLDADSAWKQDENGDIVYRASRMESQMRRGILSPCFRGDAFLNVVSTYNSVVREMTLTRRAPY